MSEFHVRIVKRSSSEDARNPAREDALLMLGPPLSGKLEGAAPTTNDQLNGCSW